MSIAAQLEQIVRRDAVVKFRKAAVRTTTRLEKTTPKKTGALARSRKVQMNTAGNVLSVTIEFAKDYGKHLDDGVRPHVIRPRSRKALRFVVGGEVVYARRVNHPGTNKHRGWFSRPTSKEDWRLTLAQFFGQG